jgi:regulator of PEP synthase PpsR (kinase-PPPase family)
MAAVMAFAAIISSKKIDSREICEVIGTALVFCGTIWTAFGVNIDPEKTVNIKEHITDFENHAKQKSYFSTEEIVKELRNLDKTCAELSKALLNASRFSFQGSIQIIIGTLFLLYPFISYFAK